MRHLHSWSAASTRGEGRTEDGRAESLEEGGGSLRLDGLHCAVDKALVETLGRTLESGLDDLCAASAPSDVARRRTSGGIANVHIATPAEAPARMTADKLSDDGSWPEGVSCFLTAS